VYFAVALLLYANVRYSLTLSMNALTNLAAAVTATTFPINSQSSVSLGVVVVVVAVAVAAAALARHF
jgi:hypothetical protein